MSGNMQCEQSVPSAHKLLTAIDRFANASADERGAIFTRIEVVEFILDLIGYTTDKPLCHYKLLEPSFGGGDFLLSAVGRLLESYQRSPIAVASLMPAIRAVELNPESFDQTKNALVELLKKHGFKAAEIKKLAEAWLIRDDFLLTEWHNDFTHIVGNPPYIRQELIPPLLLDEYRQRYTTIYDRADIYVPFIERSLRLLAPGGVLGFICADRWMKNRYGKPLRQLVSEQFHLRAYVDMVDTAAFHSDVIAYPAIFVIGNEEGSVTRLAHRPDIEKGHLAKLAKAMTSTTFPSAEVKEVGIISKGSEPWLLDAFEELAIVRRLEEKFPTLEEAGCNVGIGVATGADKAFIGPYSELDVESDRKLPLVMTRDILTGGIQWRGLGVVNPFADTGGLVSLDEYPRLKKYLDTRKDQIAARHVAQKNPTRWYRTIDRIYPALVKKPKLLIPDIKGEAHIVYDEGSYYPHHNLYYITSGEWDLRALQAVLQSGIARLFIAAYSTKMRGGYMRFQAQYLRRIRIPHWHSIPTGLRHKLIKAGRVADQSACNAAVAELYGLDSEELFFLTTILEAA